MKKAFTLIELLVVIAIIAILAAILFPVFAQAKMSAKKTQDLSNTKNQLTSIAIYVADNDDVIPPLMTSTATFFVNYDWQTDFTWPQMVFPYAKNWQIHRNPADGQANDRQSLINMGYPAGTIGVQRDYAVGLNTSYGYNYMAWSPMNANAQFQPISMTAVQDPSNTILLANSIWDRAGQPVGGGNWFIEAPHWAFSGTAYWFGGWQLTNNTSWLQYGGTWAWFNGQCNVGMGDTSAKSRPIPGLLAGVSRNAAGAVTGVFDQNLYLWDNGNRTTP